MASRRNQEPEHQSWRTRKQRCDNPNFHAFARYGGRGITYTPRWADYLVFKEEMGPRPAGTSLDHYPNRDGNDELGNCRGATRTEQSINRDCVQAALSRPRSITADLTREERAALRRLLRKARRGDVQALQLLEEHTATSLLEEEI